MSIHKEALERLALPISFHNARRAGIEEQARMVFAQAVLDGATLQEAERQAVERTKEVQHAMICRSLLIEEGKN